MHPKATTTLCLATLGLVLLSLTPSEATASPSPPRPNYFSAWESLYPNSMSGLNVELGTSSSCQLCHEQPNGGDSWNGYGWQVRQFILSGSDITAALGLAEPFDSDQDPSATLNLGEIDADTQPGWTNGPNNTIFFDDGTTQQGQTPPAAILGDLDPSSAPGSSYCQSTPNSTGQAATLSGTGSASISANDLVLSASDVPQVPGIGIFIAGPNQGQNPVFDGFLCVGSQGLQRIQQITAPVGNKVTQAIDYTGASTGTAPLNVVAGQSYNYQYWYRDPLAGGSGANLSDGYSVPHTP